MPKRLIPAILTVYACMLPRELTFEILSVAFQPFRTVLTLMMPIAVTLAAQQRMRPTVVDFLVLFCSIWAVVSLLVTASFGDAMITGLSEGLNLAFAYFIGRVSIRTSKDFQYFFKAVLPGLLICAGILAVESITHQNILRPLLRQVLGLPYYAFGTEERLGLMRAAGPFPHPILGGVFMASFLPIAWYMAPSPKSRFLGLLAVGGFFFSVSSTGFLGIIVGGGLLFTSFLHRTTKLPIFPAVVGGMVFLMVCIEVFSGSGLFSFIIRRMALSSGTGYYRMAIWEFGMADAKAHPIFGIGLRTYNRPAWMVTASVDAHWLLLTLRYGFPFSAAMLTSMISSTVMSIRGAWSPYPLDQRAAFAIGFSLISITFTGLSVYLWEGMGIWMIVLMGMGVSFGQQMAKAKRLPQTGQQGRRTVQMKARVA